MEEETATQSPSELPMEESSATQSPNELPTEESSATQISSDLPMEENSATQISSELPMEENSATQKENFGKMQHGCEHYKRRCKIRAPCCNQVFPCRHCHNEATSFLSNPKDRHEIVRQDVKQVICSVCDTEQEVARVCSNCGVIMGEYFCEVCKFYDDDIKKQQFHCEDCGICRVGGREKFFHCQKCGVFPPCKSSPHQKQLDALLNDSRIDRSVAHLLGYTQLNSRLRQIGGYSPLVRKKATVVIDSTTSEESESNSSGSEYNPFTDMSQVGDEAVQSEMEKNKSKRQAIISARIAKMSKTSLGGPGKVTTGSSSAASPCVTGDETTMVPPPRAPAGRGKAGKTPSFYDVERCPQWAGPMVDERARAGMQSCPVLPRPRKSQGFGVIGATPQYARDVLGPYMSFGGDTEKLKHEDMDDGFGAMMEDSAALMARLSFYSNAVRESKREADIRYSESQAEISRMRVALDDAVARQNRLVQDAVAAYDKGAKEGGVEGWEASLKAYRDAGHLDPAVVGNIPCYFGMSDEEDLMDGDGAVGDGVANAPGDGMLS